MRELREIRGLKYPDDFVVRWFFKRGLQDRPGRMLELGSGTGNNLTLPLAYGWTVTGVDIDPGALDDARFNLGEGPELIARDLSRGLPDKLGRFDAVMIPNLLCYLRLAEAQRLLDQLSACLAPGGEVFVRTRLVDDYRYGRGEPVETDAFRLATPETGEAGLINRFYTEAELVELLSGRLGLHEPETFRVRFDNLQAGRRVPGNSDLVVWGRTAA
jgi:SAM-dependent methyltransferase